MKTQTKITFKDAWEAVTEKYATQKAGPEFVSEYKKVKEKKDWLCKQPHRTLEIYQYASRLSSSIEDRIKELTEVQEKLLAFEKHWREFEKAGAHELDVRDSLKLLPNTFKNPHSFQEFQNSSSLNRASTDLYREVSKIQGFLDVSSYLYEEEYNKFAVQSYWALKNFINTQGLLEGDKVIVNNCGTALKDWEVKSIQLDQDGKLKHIVCKALSPMLKGSEKKFYLFDFTLQEKVNPFHAIFEELGYTWDRIEKENGEE